MVVAESQQLTGDAEKLLPDQMAVVEQTPWLADSWSGLVARRARLGHGLLFEGRLSLGLAALVDTFARLLLCEQGQGRERPCGTCPTCRQCAQGSYPDVHLFRDQPEHNQIGIDAIRALIDGAYITRHGAKRIVIIERAERLNQSSGNALLKLLEEPPPDMLFLLTTERADQLLATIRSRVQRMPVRWPQPAELSAWLEHTQGVDAKTAERMAYVDDFSQQQPIEEQDAQALAQVWVDLLAEQRVCLSALEAWKRLDRALLARWLLRLWCSASRAQQGLAADAPAQLQPAVQQLARYYSTQAMVAVHSRLMGFARQAEHSLQHDLAVEQLAFDLVDVRLPGRLDPLLNL